MKKTFKPLVFTVTFCLTASFARLSAFSASAPALPGANRMPRHIVCNSLSDEAVNYYSGDYSYDKLSALEGAKNTSTSYEAMQNNALFKKLHELMTATQTFNTTYSGYKSGSLAYYWANTDAVEQSDTYVMFYSDVLADGSVTMNREHIWPKSRASFYTKLGGADLHHLRPSVASVNIAKSNHTFGNIKSVYQSGYKEGKLNGETVYYSYPSEDLFECKDDVKGDVARILLYVYCRWEQPNLYTSMTENLPPLDPDDDADSGEKVIESLDTLLSWCAQDPVDSWEMERNDLTERVQGNRNVFIDYPELAWQLFDRDIPNDAVTPNRQGCEHTDKNGDGICDSCKKELDSTPSSLLGDCDGDGAVSISDATAIQRKIANIEAGVFIFEAADVDRDGMITIRDATAIQRYASGFANTGNIGKKI